MPYSASFIVSKLSPMLSPDIFTACYNISSLIGDMDGKINKTTAEAVLRGLQITSVGSISIDLTDQITSSTKWSDALPLEDFLGEMSARGTELYYLLKGNDDQYVVFLTDSTYRLPITSPLILRSAKLSVPLKNAVGAIYLELYALYLELLDLLPLGKIRGMNRTDLLVINNNILWLSNQLEDMDSPPMDLIRGLRNAQRTVLYIKSMSNLFIDTYSNLVLSTGDDTSE